MIKLFTEDELGFQLYLALKKSRMPCVPEELLQRIWDDTPAESRSADEILRSAWARPEAPERLLPRIEKAECLAQARHLMKLISKPAPAGHVCDDDCPEHGWRAP